MRPFSLGITTLVQGIYTMLWVIVLFDVASPTFNIEGRPDWSGMQITVGIVVLFTASVALGVLMHTVSKAVFHRVKLRWILEVVSSDSVRRRMEAAGVEELYPGGPKYSDVFAAEPPPHVYAATAVMHAIEFSVLHRSLDLYRGIQVYRDQYRLARGFILPSAAFAIVLPLWGPIIALDAAGTIGPFPIIRTQLFLLSVLAAAVCYLAFRERSFRYAAAKLLAFITLENKRDGT
ncbi:MAG: hypothetical protein OEO20_09790 [Gemmatimonadota bacterium]|nr:hypothetical protein [Gemmatimonadota bacterium]MDH3366863.1 hypothetical protein [Gemmatimonadota bacterium]MDH3478584.1 hypothetical protein [Gemmatimonadota bacterium]MDH3568989.1 hypothetical protein [Gemmatimonadota bacterium]MDH5548370.1 hypothetical protein [Gemmatimonadota bacterium]